MDCRRLFALVILVSLISVAWSQSGEQDILSEDIIYINTLQELEQLQGVVYINGSLFIHSGNNIASGDLCLLSQLRTIGGYLVIWKSPSIASLKCLRDLKTIRGDKLQFGNPPDAIFIENNVNTSNGNGLCVDNINWTSLTSFPASIANNGLNCPNCSSVCVGCWGAGPRLCQTCQQFQSGITCVEACPIGSIENSNKTCTELSINTLPAPVGSAINENLIGINWININVTNGVPLGYQVLINGTSVFVEQFTDYLPESTGLIESSALQLTYVASNLSSHTTYAFQIKILTSIGWSKASNIALITTHDGIPSSVDGLNVINITVTTALMSWAEPIAPEGEIQSYNVTMDIYTSDGWIFYKTIIVNASETYYNCSDLIEGVKYRFAVFANNRHATSTISDWFDFTTNSILPDPVTNITVSESLYNTATVNWVSSGNKFIVSLGILSYSKLLTSKLFIVYNATSIHFDNIAVNTTYQVNVTNINQYGQSLTVTYVWTTPITYPPNEDSDNENISPWLILVICIGSVFIIVIIIIVVIIKINQTRRKQRRNSVKVATSTQKVNFVNPVYQPDNSNVQRNAMQNVMYMGSEHTDENSTMHTRAAQNRAYEDTYNTTDDNNIESMYPSLPVNIPSHNTHVKGSDDKYEGDQYKILTGTQFRDGRDIFGFADVEGPTRGPDNYDHLTRTNTLYGNRTYSTLRKNAPVLQPRNMMRINNADDQ